MTAHVTPSMEHYATYPQSYLSLGTNPANKHNCFNEKAEALGIVNEYTKPIQISRFGHKEVILTPHGPHKRGYDACYHYSSLCQGFYLTHTHIHFKKVRG